MDTRETLVVAPTSDGQAVDIDYDISNKRLDAWSRRNGSHQVLSCLCRGSRHKGHRGACVVILVPTLYIHYDISNKRLDAWSRRNGAHQVLSCLCQQAKAQFLMNLRGLVIDQR